MLFTESQRHEALGWLVFLAGTKGWEAYAYRHAQDMAKQWPQDFGDMPRELVEIMRRAKGEPAK